MQDLGICFGNSLPLLEHLIRSTSSVNPIKWSKMFVKPVVDLREFIQQEICYTRCQGGCDGASKNLVFLTDQSARAGY
ncbi:Hypothetical predicted protein, partial [Paramuricea clavata]